MLRVEVFREVVVYEDARGDFGFLSCDIGGLLSLKRLGGGFGLGDGSNWLGDGDLFGLREGEDSPKGGGEWDEDLHCRR